LKTGGFLLAAIAESQPVAIFEHGGAGEPRFGGKTGDFLKDRDERWAKPGRHSALVTENVST
jgi:hypothetical protein